MTALLIRYFNYDHTELLIGSSSFGDIDLLINLVLVVAEHATGRPSRAELRVRVN